MKNHYQILVIGGGNAGLSLSAHLLLKNNKLDIGIVEPSDKHYYQPAWTLVGGGVYNIQDTERNAVKSPMIIWWYVRVSNSIGIK